MVNLEGGSDFPWILDLKTGLFHVFQKEES